MKKKMLYIIILICIVLVLIAVLFYLNKSKRTYNNYVNPNQDTNTSEDLNVTAHRMLFSSDNVVQVISVSRKSKEIDSIELTTEFNESKYIRKRVFYAIDQFTHSEYTDPFECYYDLENKTVVSEQANGLKEYAITFKFNNERYIAVNSSTGYNIAILKL